VHEIIADFLLGGILIFSAICVLYLSWVVEQLMIEYSRLVKIFDCIFMFFCYASGCFLFYWSLVGLFMFGVDSTAWCVSFAFWSSFGIFLCIPWEKGERDSALMIRFVSP